MQDVINGSSTFNTHVNTCGLHDEQGVIFLLMCVCVDYAYLLVCMSIHTSLCVCVCVDILVNVHVSSFYVFTCI